MGGREERHKPEAHERGREEQRRGQQERHSGHRDGQCRLHGKHPPSFGPDYVHKRTPERLYHPRKVEPSCEECHLSQGHSEVDVHKHRECVYCKIGQSFGDI